MTTLVQAAATFGPEATDITGVAAVDVSISQWHNAALAVAAAGGSYLDFVAAADLPTDGFQVVVHVMPAIGVGGVLLRTTVSAGQPELTSIGEVWAGATWHEREITDLFGITFLNSADDRPLLTARVGPAPLLKSSTLQARLSQSWPGGFDPADKADAKRRLPPGVPDVATQELAP